MIIVRLGPEAGIQLEYLKIEPPGSNFGQKTTFL